MVDCQLREHNKALVPATCTVAAGSVELRLGQTARMCNTEGDRRRNEPEPHDHPKVRHSAKPSQHRERSETKDSSPPCSSRGAEYPEGRPQLRARFPEETSPKASIL